jgi:TPR repeat protein
LRAYAEGDYQRAADGLQQAAAKGHPEAQRVLGVMQLLGQGTPQDPVSAARWIQSSARLGNSGAQELMSYLLTQGLGVDKDYGQAYAWLKLVALRTDDPARASTIQTAIARLTSTMSKEQLARARALSRDYCSKFLHPFL